jgi:DNA-binding transcriptional MerR regulator
MVDAHSSLQPGAGPRRAGKSDAAFRTISEVSEALDVPQHVLRFWETKFAQVKPLKRAGGRRYYRPEDVALLRTIRDLLYRDGFTIKGAQKLLRESGPKRLITAAATGAVVAERASALLGVDGAASTPPEEPKPEESLGHSSAASPSANATSPASALGERAVLEGILKELEALRELVRARLK